MSTDRMASVRQTLEAHNASNPPKLIDIDAYFQCLAEAGGTTDETRADATWEDHEDCGLPRILARKVAKIFRGPEPEPQAQQIIVRDDDPDKIAKGMIPRQLIEEYPLDQPKHAFTLRLAELADGRRFMVFDSKGAKDVETSLKLFNELDDFGEQLSVRVGDDPTPRRVFFVGENPGKLAMEHPLWPGTPLRPGGISANDCRWGEIEERVRQVLYLAASVTNEIDSSRVNEVDIFLEAKDRGYDGVCLRYPEAAAKLQELAIMNDEPCLKVILGSSSPTNGTRKQNPFIVGNKRT